MSFWDAMRELDSAGPTNSSLGFVFGLAKDVARATPLQTSRLFARYGKERLSTRREGNNAESARIGTSPRPELARGLEELDRIAVRIFELDLLTARSDFHFVAKMKSCSF